MKNAFFHLRLSMAIMLLYLVASIESRTGGFFFTTPRNSKVQSSTYNRLFGSVVKPAVLEIRGGEIVELNSLEHTEKLVSEANELEKLVVLDFTAYNCPPCKMIAPFFEELSESEEFQDSVVFLKVNVNENPDVAAKYEVDGWPTFLFIKDGEVKDSIVGGNAAKLGLYGMVSKHATKK